MKDASALCLLPKELQKGASCSFFLLPTPPKHICENTTFYMKVLNAKVEN